MSTIPDFGGLELGPPAASGSPADWAQRVEEATGPRTDGARALGEATGRGAGGATGEPREGRPAPPLFTAADLRGLDFLDTYPGIAPYLRGPYPTMYTTQPWTIRQYAGFSTASE